MEYDSLEQTTNINNPKRIISSNLLNINSKGIGKEERILRNPTKKQLTLKTDSKEFYGNFVKNFESTYQLY